MLTVTESAGAHLARVLVKANAADEKAVRFVSEEDRLVPKLDTKRPGDMAFDHDGKTVLVLDTGIADTLANRTLDVTDTHAGPRLYLREA
jgi:hypothetical protein